MRLLVEAVPQVVGQLDRVCDHLLGGQGVGRVETRIGLACAPLVPCHHDEVLLEAGVASHRPDVGAAGASGEIQQHRIVDVPPSDHHNLVVAAEFDSRQLGDTSLQRLTVWTDDRCGRGGPADRPCYDQHDEAQHTGHGPRCATERRRGAESGRQPGTVQGAGGERQQCHEPVCNPTDDEGSDAQCRVEMDCVDRGSGNAEPNQFEDDHEGGRCGQHRPFAPQHHSRHHADEQRCGDGDEGLGRRGGPPRRGQRGDDGEQRSETGDGEYSGPLPRPDRLQPGSRIGRAGRVGYFDLDGLGHGSLLGRRTIVGLSIRSEHIAASTRDQRADGKDSGPPSAHTP